MPVVIVLAVLLGIYVLKIIVGLFTRPVATLARLATLVCNFLGLIALTLFGFGLAYRLGWSEIEFELGVTVVAGLAVVVLFALSAWFSRSRRRSEMRRLQRDFDAVQRAEARRNAS